MTTQIEWVPYIRQIKGVCAERHSILFDKPTDVLTLKDRRFRGRLITVNKVGCPVCAGQYFKLIEYCGEAFGKCIVCSYDNTLFRQFRAFQKIDRDEVLSDWPH